MTAYESMVMRRIITWKSGRIPNSNKKKNELLQKVFEEFLADWKEPEDFSETFREVMHSKLTELEREIFERHYRDAKTYAEISAELYLSRGYIQNKELEATIKLSDTLLFERLYQGRSAFEAEMQNRKQAELSGNHDPKISDIPISQVDSLSRRTSNALQRIGCHTIGDVLKCENLTNQRRCGKKAVEEAIHVLHEMGCDTSLLERQIA